MEYKQKNIDQDKLDQACYDLRQLSYRYEDITTDVLSTLELEKPILKQAVHELLEDSIVYLEPGISVNEALDPNSNACIKDKNPRWKQKPWQGQTVIESERPVQAIDALIDNDAHRRLLESMDPDSILYLPCVVDGLKPGMTGRCDYDDAPEVKELFKQLGLTARFQSESGRMLFQVGRDERYIKNRDWNCEDELFGDFLGVPDEDNQWYNEYEEGLGKINKVTPIPKHLNLSKENWPDLKYARLVSWVCRPTKEGLQRTIEIGKEWYEFTQKLDNEYEYSEPLRNARIRMKRMDHIWYSFE